MYFYCTYLPFSVGKKVTSATGVYSVHHSFNLLRILETIWVFRDDHYDKIYI